MIYLRVLWKPSKRIIHLHERQQLKKIIINQSFVLHVQFDLPKNVSIFY